MKTQKFWDITPQGVSQIIPLEIAISQRSSPATRYRRWFAELLVRVLRLVSRQRHPIKIELAEAVRSHLEIAVDLVALGYEQFNEG